MSTTCRGVVGLSLVAALAGWMALGLAAGCTATAEEPAPKRAKPAAALPSRGPVPLSTIKTELVTAKTQLQRTMQALNALQKSPAAGAKANYDAFVDEYDKLTSTSDAVSARSDDLKQRVSSYHAMWEGEVGVVDPELRRQALERKTESDRIFNTVQTELELTRNSFRPLMSDLKSIGDSLGGNPDPAKLNAIAPRVAKANAQAKAVDAHAGAIIAAIDEITASTGEAGTR